MKTYTNTNTYAAYLSQEEFHGLIHKTTKLVTENMAFGKREHPLLGIDCIARKEIRSGITIATTLLSRCIGILIESEHKKDGVPSLVTIFHLPPYNTEDACKNALYSSVQSVIKEGEKDFGISKIIFAGGRINNEENERFHEFHRRAIIEPLMQEWGDSKTIYVPPEEDVRHTRLMYRDGRPKVFHYLYGGVAEVII